MAVLASDWLRHFRLFYVTDDKNLMKFEKKQGLNVFYKVNVYRADQKTKMAALASWLVETFATSPLELLNINLWNLIGSKN